MMMMMMPMPMPIRFLFRRPSFARHDLTLLARAVASRSLATTASAKDESTSSQRTTLRSTSLGLEASLVQPHLTSISQLPEVAAVLENPQRHSTTSVTTTVESLRRAGDIFASFAVGGPEHTAVLTMLAEVQQTQLLDYEGARATVEQIFKFVQDTTPSIRFEVSLALAKTMWMQGDFADCFRQTRTLKDTVTQEFPLHVAAVDNAHVLSTLMHEGPAAAHTEALSLDVVGLPAPAQAAQCLNLGVVEALWGLSNDCQGDITCSTQFDIAKQTWQQGVALLADAADTPLRHALEGRLQSNLAYAALQFAGRSESHISKASEHAREALQALEHIRTDETDSLPDEGWTRALSLVAQCYHRAGHAVTAEGLLQSALDETRALKNMTPHCILERRAAYQAYSALCKDWEKRQGDADRFLANSRQLKSQLKGGWKDATELHCSLWFWTPHKFA